MTDAQLERILAALLAIQAEVAALRMQLKPPVVKAQSLGPLANYARVRDAFYEKHYPHPRRNTPNA